MGKKLGHALALYGYRVGDMWLVCVYAIWWVRSAALWLLFIGIYLLFIIICVRSFRIMTIYARRIRDRQQNAMRETIDRNISIRSLPLQGSGSGGLRAVGDSYFDFFSLIILKQVNTVMEEEFFRYLKIHPRPSFPPLQVYLVQNHKISKLIDSTQNCFWKFWC